MFLTFLFLSIAFIYLIFYLLTLIYSLIWVRNHLISINCLLATIGIIVGAFFLTSVEYLFDGVPDKVTYLLSLTNSPTFSLQVTHLLDIIPKYAYIPFIVIPWVFNALTFMLLYSKNESEAEFIFFFVVLAFPFIVNIFIVYWLIDNRKDILLRNCLYPNLLIKLLMSDKLRTKKIFKRIPFDYSLREHSDAIIKSRNKSVTLGLDDIIVELGRKYFKVEKNSFYLYTISDTNAISINLLELMYNTKMKNDLYTIIRGKLMMDYAIPAEIRESYIDWYFKKTTLDNLLKKMIDQLSDGKKAEFITPDLLISSGLINRLRSVFYTWLDTFEKSKYIKLIVENIKNSDDPNKYDYCVALGSISGSTSPFHSYLNKMVLEEKMIEPLEILISKILKELKLPFEWISSYTSTMVSLSLEDTCFDNLLKWKNALADLNQPTKYGNEFYAESREYMDLYNCDKGKFYHWDRREFLPKEARFLVDAVSDIIVHDEEIAFEILSYVGIRTPHIFHSSKEKFKRLPERFKVELLEYCASYVRDRINSYRDGSRFYSGAIIPLCEIYKMLSSLTEFEDKYLSLFEGLIKEFEQVVDEIRRERANAPYVASDREYDRPDTGPFYDMEPIRRKRELEHRINHAFLGGAIRGDDFLDTLGNLPD